MKALKILALILVMMLACEPTLGDRSDYMQVWREDSSVMLVVNVPNTWFRVFVNGAFMIENHCGLYDEFCSCEQAIDPNQLPEGKLKFELLSDNIYEIDYL